MTIDEAVELLREARSVIRPIHTLDSATGHYRWFHDTLCQRIDEALARHNAEEQTTVEWISFGAWCEKSSKIDGFQLTVRAHALPGGPWHWEAPRCSGYAPTKDEAKAAAIAAARGQK